MESVKSLKCSVSSCTAAIHMSSCEWLLKLLTEVYSAAGGTHRDRGHGKLPEGPALRYWKSL